MWNVQYCPLQCSSRPKVQPSIPNPLLSPTLLCKSLQPALPIIRFSVLSREILFRTLTLTVFSGQVLWKARCFMLTKFTVDGGLKRQSGVQVLKGMRVINAGGSQMSSRSRCFAWALMVTLITSSDGHRPSRLVGAGSTFSPVPTLEEGEREMTILLFLLGS